MVRALPAPTSGLGCAMLLTRCRPEMANKPLPPLDYLKSILQYNPETGELLWTKTVGPKAKAGSTAGTTMTTNHKRKKSYSWMQVGIKGKAYQSHRIAWYLYYGVDPQHAFVDHINQNPLDNRIANLRLVNHNENNWNASGCLANNSSGFRGVYKHKQSGKWAACMTVNGKTKHLGVFGSPEEASKAYEKAYADRLHHIAVCAA